MADDLKRVGLTFTADGAVDFKKTLKEVNAAVKENYSEYKLAQSQWDKSTSSVEKLAARQEYLAKQTDAYSDKVSILEKELDNLEGAEKRDNKAIEDKKAQLNQAQAKLNEYERDLREVNIQLETGAAKLKQYGSNVQNVGDKMSKIGDGMTKNVTAPIIATGAAAMAAFNEVDEGYDILIQKTGATGETLQNMKGIVNDLAKTIPTDFSIASEAVGEVNTRFELTGEALQELSRRFIQFAELNNSNVSTSIDTVQNVLEAFEIETADATKLLDVMNKVGQDTGVSMDVLCTTLVGNATALQEMGMDAYQSIEFLGRVAKSGVETESVITGLKKALKSATDQGKPLNVALMELQDTIINGKDGMDGLSAAYDLFGKSGAGIYTAVKNGSIDFKMLADSQKIVAESMGSVNDTYEATLDPSDKMTLVMNELKELGYETAIAFQPLFSILVENMIPIIEKISEKWKSLSPQTQESIAKIALIVAALGPLFSIGGRLISGIGKIISVASKIIPVIAGLNPVVFGVIAAITVLIGVGVFLYKNWDSIKEIAGQIKEKVVESWNNLKEKTVEAWNSLKEKTLEAWTNLKEETAETWTNLKEKTSETWTKIKDTCSEAMSGAKEQISSSLGNIKQAYIDHGGGIKGVVAGYMTAVKEYYKLGFNAIDKLTGGKLSDIVNTFKDKFEKAKNIVKEALEKMKSFFKFEWSLPHLKMPHFKISGSFSLNPPSVPSFGVDWYAKGAILNRPTIFGKMGEKFLGGGEAGQEAVLPISNLLEYIRTANNEQLGQMMQIMEEALFNAFVKALKTVRMSMVLDEEKVGELFADYLRKELFT